MGLLEYTETSPTPMHDRWQCSLRQHLARPNRPDAADIPIVVPRPGSYECPAELAIRQEGLTPQVEHLHGDQAYGEMLERVWRRGRGFVLVEHDVVPWPGAIQAFWDCREPWCVYEYPQGRADLAAALGCVKFSNEIVAGMPGLPDKWRGYGWQSIDGLLVRGIWEALRLVWHVHCPPVAHARQRGG